MAGMTRINSKSVAVALTTLVLGALAACTDDGPIAPSDQGGTVSPDLTTRPQGLQDRGPLERVQFIHFRRGARPPWAGGGNGGEDTSSCYAFIANGAKWATPENWEVFNGSVDNDITDSHLKDRVASALTSWESEAGTPIAGNGSLGDIAVDLNSLDDHNVVQFGNVNYSGAIAVTNVWGYFRGPPGSREIVEWDMILDDVDFGWSLTGEGDKMDVLNIVAHEVGHALGMDHPENTCTEETMYAYATEGETKKRDLNAGDIAGIQDLY